MDLRKKEKNQVKDIKKLLAFLWVARMLTGIQGDVLRYMEPGMLEDIINNNLAIPMTNEMLAIMAVMMLVPIFMVYLSLELPYKISRPLNIIIALFFIILDGTGFIIARPLYENIMGVGYVVFCALIIWYAWKWPKEEN